MRGHSICPAFFAGEIIVLDVKQPQLVPGHPLLEQVSASL
jgi:hypothetical protein